MKAPSPLPGPRVGARCGYRSQVQLPWPLPGHSPCDPVGRPGEGRHLWLRNLGRLWGTRVSDWTSEKRVSQAYPERSQRQHRHFFSHRAQWCLLGPEIPVAWAVPRVGTYYVPSTVLAAGRSEEQAPAFEVLSSPQIAGWDPTWQGIRKGFLEEVALR